MNAPKSRLGAIATISLAHLLNDWYMNLIQTLLPFLVAAGLGVGRGAFLITAFTTTSSILQPVFGYLVDRRNQRWLVYAGTLWMAVLLGVVGLTDDYALLFCLVLFSGLGTAAFHPQASAMIGMVSGGRRGLFQGIFTAAGNVGWALTPLLVVPFISSRGLSATPYLAVPGVLVAALLLVSAPGKAAGRGGEAAPMLPLLRANWRELAKIVLVVSCRSVTYFGFIAFLPLYLKERGVPLLSSSRLLFIMLFSGAVAGVIGGSLSDRFGRRAIIALSLLAAAPLFHLAIHAEGLALEVFLALAGAALLASFSVTVVLAQEVISKNAAMASGLTLGFGVGMGGLGVGLVGQLGEAVGMDAAMHLLAWFPLVSGLAGLSLKRRGVAVLGR
jgi:FSR family fosmidomycin resistance protein-like MFS transporter